MKQNETKTFRVLLNASYLGWYYLPGIQAEALWDNDYMVQMKWWWLKWCNDKVQAQVSRSKVKSYNEFFVTANWYFNFQMTRDT